METLIKILDIIEDAFFAAIFRIRRLFSRRPKERRKVPRVRQTLPSS